MTTSPAWTERIGYQRDWVWRGWQIRYSFMPAKNPQDADNPPLILLHGFGAAIEHWRHNIPILSQNHRVYAVDLLGFGGSRKVQVPYTVNLWVEQIHDFWQTFINRPVVLVGNSIGSLVSMALAGKYPEMVAGLVMLSLPDVSRRREMIADWLLNIVTPIENFFTSPWLLKPIFYYLRRPQVLKKWTGIAYEDKKAVSEELVQIIAAPTLDEGAAEAFISLAQAVNHPEYCPPAKLILPRLEIPILLCWGKQDRMVPVQLAQGFVSLNPRIKYVEFARAGHCLQDECPDRFNPILLEWLESVPVL
ncbi:alpha/beta fold hydrolase [Microcystis wesenbergii FACHB-1317]|uniref:alpha/beta fold hydrolase n=1 Tax=Microcystis TaxID=1125 RepID=UPI000E37236E|nr:alpha/beta fold hydrolase [Microcystis aeruginosa]MBD2287605.1 alpha/beta fold hydrolase [Microcystis wesenbergii FACHB-1317]NCQ90343.1 alpha/beta fold hydrolase [Microcystis aeruginosa LG13-13]NCR02840.1 alpha/beta fold hydrolase [Microcystis aeruginosa LG13-03]NCR61831.1 alpha/beta fold hydrolase [Microcystis aeruginosa LG11-05]REJ47420.1 MAG: alpha/beta fold hydrolase [Microcystis aeruginosa TA09]